MTGRLLAREFFDRPVLTIAPALLGCVIEHETGEGTVAIRLTEVEAYDGPNDPGSHAYRGRTRRNEVMFGPPGHVYVYFTYGMHWCMNVVCGSEGRASAVLLRAGEVVQGVDLARRRRSAARNERELARGPARLASALGIDGTRNGADACSAASPLRLRPGGPVADDVIRSGPRVGLTNGAVRPWRFWLAEEPTVSVYRPAKPRLRGNSPSGTRSGSLVTEPTTTTKDSAS